MTAWHRRILLGVLSSALAGCAVTAGHTPTAQDVPARWSEAPDSRTPAATAEAAWWMTFNDPELDRLIERARRANLDLQLVQTRVREARGRRTIAGSARVPVLGAMASFAREQESQNAPNPLRVLPDGEAELPGQPESLFQGGFDAKWEIDLFGGARRSAEAAQADVEAAMYDHGAVLLSLLAEVSRNYIVLRSAQQQSRIARENLAARQDTLTLVRARRAGGMATDADVERAEAQVEGTASQLPVFDTVYKQALHRLGVLIGEPPGALADELRAEGLQPVASVQPPIGLPSDLLRQRPDIRSAERAVAAAYARRDAAVADLYPKVSLLGTVGLASVAAGNFFSGASALWSIGPSITWPIFRGGQIVATIEVRDAQQQRALIVYRRAILNGIEDAENAMAAYQHEKTRRALLARAVEAEQRATAYARDRYVGGLIDFRDVLDAQRGLFLAQSELAQSDAATSLGLVALYKALGGGWNASSLAAPQAARLPMQESETQ